MKLRTALLVITLSLGIGAISSQVLNKKSKGAAPAEEINKVAEYRAKSRENLKPYRFDGSKITYFNYNYYDQMKEIEILLFNGIDYKFCFNSDGAPKAIAIKIYDKPSSAKGRELLFEQGGVSQKDVTVFSKDLLAKLQEANSAITSLKRIYVEYHIPISSQKIEAKTVESKKRGDEETAAPQEKGVVVLSYGYKNV